MSKQIPPKLYKYQSLASGSHVLENLRQDSVWFSKPSMLNDPFDCAVPIIYSNTGGELEILIKMLSDKAREQGKLGAIEAGEAYYLTNGKPNERFRDLVEHTGRNDMQEKLKQFQEMGVACFSEEFDNILMWSHYADGHRGICLEFDTSFFPFKETEKVHKVKYRNSYPTLSPLYIMQNREMPFDPLITKSLSWKYEKEWRFLMDKGETLFKYEPRALSAIYFGCTINSDLMKQISTMPAKSATRLFTMKRSETRFVLEFAPYH